MTFLSGLGIVLSLVFGCLLLALVAELYYLLWWKRQSLINGNSSQRIEQDYSNHTKEMLYLFCWDKQPSSVINSNIQSSNSTIVANSCDVNSENDSDLEMGLGASRKDLLLRALGEESIESELMRLHNLAGPPRFLFTIKEETKEDLESEDGRSKRGGSRTRSLGDLIVALDSQSPFLMSPMASPQLFKGGGLATDNNYDNPLFESSMDVSELLRLRSSPPPKFKFLRDAEEKLYRRLLEEAQRKSGVLQEVNNNDSLVENTDIVNNDLLKSKDMDAVHCSSQVLPLDSSPQLKRNLLYIRSCQDLIS